MANIERKTRGRQKVPLMRMEKESNRLVTFSKRRAGLFKKASELCTLCGVEATIVVFSPGKKPYSFGHPSVDAITNRFLNADIFPNSNFFHGQTSDPHQNESVLMCNMQLTLIHDHLEWEKKHQEGLTNDRKTKKEDFNWLAEAEEFGGENLENLKGLLNPFKNFVSQMYHKFVIEVNNTNDSLLTGSNASAPIYQFSPLGMLGGRNPVSTLYGGQPQQMANMIPSDLVGGPVSFDPSPMMMMMMNQTSTGEGFGDPSLTRGSSGIAIDHLLNGNVNANVSANANANASVNANPIPSLQNPIGFGFPNPNLMPSFQGENNPIGSQFDGLPSLPSMNMGMNPMPSGPSMNLGINSMPVDIQNLVPSSSSSQAGINSMNTSSAPYQLQNGFGVGFGFGNGLY